MKDRKAELMSAQKELTRNETCRGKLMAMSGLKITDNPHKEGSVLHNYWLKGFKSYKP